MRLQGVRRMWRSFRSPRVFDIALVVALELFGAAMAVIAASAAPGMLPIIVFFMIASVPLLARRKHPIPVAAITVALELCSALIERPPGVGLPQLIAMYGLGRYASGARAGLAAGAAAAGYGTLALFNTGPGPAVGPAVALPLIPVVLGGFFRLRYELRERRMAERAERAVRAERQRIARELHDVVAHHISVINVLVGAGRTTMATDPERAQEVLITAERTAREAMTEMRQLLHVLRAEETDEPENHAEVGTANLPGLVEQASRSGVPASLEVTGPAVPLPTAVDHAIYRIVQEALTNTRKHAPGARASVRLAYLGDAVEVEVLDDGSTSPVDDGVPGYGLGGMAERVALCGGELQTGRRPEGGFRVYARIPVEPVAPERPREAADSI